MVLKDMTGKRCGRLTVVARAPNRTDRVAWDCICDCGAACVVLGKLLRNGFTKSCGCYRRELSKVTNMRHGMRHTAEYRIWSGMLYRCYNPSSPAFADYGGRQIGVCGGWRGANGFAQFVSDMGCRPSPQHSLDRIDNGGDYSPSNCRWAPRLMQARNTRRNRLLEYNGETQCVSAWAEATGLLPATIIARINAGWSIRDTLCRPLRRSHKT